MWAWQQHISLGLSLLAFFRIHFFFEWRTSDQQNTENMKKTKFKFNTNLPICIGIMAVNCDIIQRTNNMYFTGIRNRNKTQS